MDLIPAWSREALPEAKWCLLPLSALSAFCLCLWDALVLERGDPKSRGQDWFWQRKDFLNTILYLHVNPSSPSLGALNSVGNKFSLCLWECTNDWSQLGQDLRVRASFIALSILLSRLVNSWMLWLQYLCFAPKNYRPNRESWNTLLLRTPLQLLPSWPKPTSPLQSSSHNRGTNSESTGITRWQHKSPPISRLLGVRVSILLIPFQDTSSSRWVSLPNHHCLSHHQLHSGKNENWNHRAPSCSSDFPDKHQSLLEKMVSKDFSRINCNIMHFIDIVFWERREWEKQKNPGNSKILQKILSCE